MLVISFHHGIATISLTAFSFLCVITGFVKSIGSLYVLFTFSGFHLHACTYSWHHWIRLIESLVTRRHFLYRANGTCPWTCPVQGVNWVEFVLRMFYSCNEYSVSGVCGRTPNALIFSGSFIYPSLSCRMACIHCICNFSQCVCVCFWHTYISPSLTTNCFRTWHEAAACDMSAAYEISVSK